MILTLSLPTFPMAADAAEEEAEALEVGEEILTYTEEVELRDTFTKHFRRSDGQYVAVVYAEPVHAGESGNMTDIDNRLTYRASSGRYESANEEFAVSFAPTPDADRTVSVSFEGYTLSWRVDAVRNLQTSGWETMSVSAVTPIAVQPERASSFATASVTDTGFVDASSLSVFTKEQISSTFTSVSKIRYQNAFTGGNGVDLSYTLAPNRLEEDIILKSKNDIRSYVLTMSAEGLTAVKQADNSILFVDGSGKEVFTVGAPWMQDAEYAFSDSITVSLVQKGDTVTLIYTPDAAWLNDADRVYPVLIDPSVRSRNYTSNYEDGMITPTMTSIATTQTSTRVGTTGGYETYTKILSYPKLYSGMSVESVTMSYYGSRSSINHKVRILSTEVDFASMTGANRPMGTATVYSPTVTLISSSSGSYYKHTYDITSAYQSYYYSYGYNALNYIKGFRLYNGDSTVTTGTVYTSSEGAADYRPVLEITYTHSHDVPIASGGVYTLVNKNSGKAMTASSGGTNVYQMTKVITNMQAFTFVGSQGFYTIEPIVRNGEALTWNHSGSTSSQGVTNLYASDESTADLDKQEFMVLYVSTDDNGYDYYAIVSRADTRYALTASGTANGTASAPTSVTTAGNIYMGLYTGSASQLWRLESGRKPVYVGNNIVENDGQTFAFDYGVGEPMIQPYGYVTAYGETISWVSSDPSVVSFDTNGKVTIHDIGEATLTANVTGSGTSRSYSYTVVIAVENGVYYIRNTLTNSYLSIPDNTPSNGDDIIMQSKATEGDAMYRQLWKVYHIGNGRYSVRSMANLSYALDETGGVIDVWSVGLTDTRAGVPDYAEWDFLVNSGAFYRIRHKGLDSETLYATSSGIGINTAATTPLLAQGAGQEWALEKMSVTTPSVHLIGAPAYLAPEENADVNATYYTTALASQTVTWTSSDTSVAIVDGNGVVTGVSVGIATITATSQANTSVSVSFDLYVTSSDRILHLYSYEAAMTKLAELYDVALEYDNTPRNALLLTMQFIRRTRYNSDSWETVAGTVDSQFVDYVNLNYTSLYNHFTLGNTEEYYYLDPNGEGYVDLIHLCATLNGLLYDSHGFKATMAGEANVDNLCGWAGDLQTLCRDVLVNTNCSNDYNVIYNATYAMIGNEAYSLSMMDLLADTDAYNVYNLLNSSSSNFFSALSTYYDSYVGTRYTQFTNGWSKQEIYDCVRIYTTNIFFLFVEWPLWEEFDIDVTNTQADAIATAFIDYIWEKIQNES